MTTPPPLQDERANEPQPRLTVRLTSFPESNGKRNWTALLVRVGEWGGLIGNCGGITVDRGECWNRVAYEAERAKFLIGERDTEPHILDYGDDIDTPEKWAGEVRGGRPLRRMNAARASLAAGPAPLTDAPARNALQELVSSSQELGLYDDHMLSNNPLVRGIGESPAPAVQQGPICKACNDTGLLQFNDDPQYATDCPACEDSAQRWQAEREAQPPASAQQAAEPALFALPSSIADSVTAIEASIDLIERVINQKREPGWSYRNTITSNRNAIRARCADIRAALAGQPAERGAR